MGRQPGGWRFAVAVVTAVGTVLAAATPASAAWIAPASRVDNRAEGFSEVTGGDIGTGGRTVVLFPQTREGQAASDAALFANTSPLGPPAWLATPSGVPLPDGVGAGSGPSYRVKVAPDGSARGIFVFSNRVYAVSWPASGSPSVAATPILTGISTLSPRLAMSADGTAHIVATTTGTAMVRYVRLAPDGSVTGDETLGAGTEPDIAASAAGLVVGYTKAAGGSMDVVLRRRVGSAGEFSPEASGVVNVADPADQPAVAIDAAGDITVAFRESPPRTGNVVPNPTHVRYARWLASSPTPGNPRTVSEPPPAPAPAASGPNNSAPRIAVDDAGRVTFAWSATPPQGGRTDILTSELVNGVRLAIENLGEGIRLALGVNPSGHAVIVFHTPANLDANVVGMERLTGNSFSNRTTLQLSGSGAGLSPSTLPPRLDVTRSQADAFFLQRFGSGAGATVAGIAARNALTTVPPASQPLAEARGCPAANNTITGGAGDDALTGTDGHDNLLGLAGNDRLAGLAGNDCIRGEGGNDDASGGAGNDAIDGGEGDDTSRGEIGDDVLLGDAGTDLLAGGEGVDRLDGGASADRLSAGAGDDEAAGGEGNDRIFLSSGNDLAQGGDGDDLMSAGSGTDRLFGEAGDDRLVGSSGRNDLRGGDGNDRLRGGAGRDTLIGGDGLDRMFGLGGADLLIGGIGVDVVKGHEGNDRLYGRDGADRLRGGGGRDRIVGGAGDDRLWGDKGKDRISAGSGNDVIHGADGAVDVVTCGRGSDLAVADRRDSVARNCERVVFRAPAP